MKFTYVISLAPKLELYFILSLFDSRDLIRSSNGNLQQIL